MFFFPTPQPKIVFPISHELNYSHRAPLSGVNATWGKFPSTLPLLEALRLHYSGETLPGKPFPSLLRLLVLTPAGELRRSQLPLQKVTHPFFMAPYSEYPLLLGFSLLGLLGGTVNYLHEGFMGLETEPYLLLLLLVTLRWCGDLESLGANPALYNSSVRRNLLLGILLFIISEVMVFFALF
jgi:hypothetical protein